MYVEVIITDLLKDILINALEKEEINIVFPNLKISVEEVVETECYRALQKIKTVIEDDSLEDNECFVKIEEIVYILESIGSNGDRHNFG